MGQRLHKISKYRPSIFQGRLDFSPRAGVSLTAEHPSEQIVFRTLIAALFGLVLTYVYCVGSSVLNVIARKEALTQTASLQTSVSTLESSYYNASAGITPRSGEQLGLLPVSETAFVYRPGAAAAVTMGRNEL